MVNALVNQGDKVTVLCSHPIYPSWVPVPSNSKMRGVKIIRGGSKIRYTKKAFIRRAVLELWFTIFVVKNIFKHKKEIDIIIPVFPPSLAFFVILPFLVKTRKIGMVHDLQEVYSKEKKGVFNKLISFFINKIEGISFRKCDKVIFLSGEMRDTAQDYYNLSKEKTTVQYPFVTLNTDNISNDLEKVLPEDKANIVYSGALGEKQNPKGIYSFFEYASKCIQKAEFHFFSQGDVFEDLKRMNNNPLIKFHNLVPKKNIEELYNRSSIQIIPQAPGTSKGSLPSKLPNLMASGCKILCITDEYSEIELLFNKYNLERVVVSWDNNILLENLEYLLNKDMKSNSKQMDIANKFFSIKSMINKIRDKDD